MFLFIIIIALCLDFSEILDSIKEQVFWLFVAKSLQLCPTLCDPMDCSLLGSSTHGIFQARVLDWGAIAFSESAYYF